MTAPQYELLEMLGRGGFGTVYRCRYVGENGFTKVVAVKVLNAETEGVAELAMRLRDDGGTAVCLLLPKDRARKRSDGAK